MDDTFKIALDIVLKFEGGYSNDLNDPGKATNFGIIQEVYNEYRSFKRLSPKEVKEIEQNEVEGIYYNYYWLKGDCDKFPRRLAFCHFDSCVNCGVERSNKFLQKSVNVIVDGILGPKTFEGINNLKNTDGLENIITKYLNWRREYYRELSTKRPQLRKFLNGWLNRVNQLQTILKGE